jgi:hypothetical protein
MLCVSEHPVSFRAFRRTVYTRPYASDLALLLIPWLAGRNEPNGLRNDLATNLLHLGAKIPSQSVANRSLCTIKILKLMSLNSMVDS